MKKSVLFFFCLTVFCLGFIETAAQRNRIAKTNVTKVFQPLKLQPSTSLQTLLDSAVGETLNKFAAKKATSNDIAATLIDLRDAKNFRVASYRGNVRIYPASVVKMFYMAAVHQWLEDGRIKASTPEIERALKDMIADSSNDATHFIVDILTDTSNGGELAPRELKIYAEKREAINNFFASLGYENINVNQKTYCEDLYGRERQFWDAGKNRNMLTTDATARLMAEIALGKIVSPERSRLMMNLMKRDFTGASKDPDSQSHGFTALALNELNLKNASLWSKAGWTSKTRHDAAYIETADGLKLVLVIFTENLAEEREIISSVAGKILKNFK